MTKRIKATESKQLDNRHKLQIICEAIFICERKNKILNLNFKLELEL